MRSPLATAVVTCAIWRTCSVRLAAITFTVSVRSRHVPLTPLTSAWPPSLPSVPTSRATRVTSSANEPSWSTIAFTVWPIAANSPLTGWPSIVSAIFWRQVALRDGRDDAPDLGGRADEVVDKRVDRLDGVAPAAVDACPARRARSCGRRGRRPGRGARAPWPSARSSRRARCTRSWTSPITSRRRAAQAHAEVAVARGGEDAQQLLEGGVVVRLAVRGAAPPFAVALRPAGFAPVAML